MRVSYGMTFVTLKPDLCSTRPSILGNCGSNSKSLIFKHIIHNSSLASRHENSVWWLSENLTNEESTLVWLMVYHLFSVKLLTHLPLDKMAAILADDIFKYIFLNENDGIPIQISLKFVPRSPNWQ